MAKYNKKVVDQICKLIESDSYIISEICRLSGISESIYFEWKASKVEFSEMIQAAEDKRRQYFVVEAKKSLLKKIQGYTVKEKKVTTYYPELKVGETRRKRIIKDQTLTDKFIQPDTSAIIFALTNCDPDNWKNKQNSDITSGGEKLQFGTKELSKEEAIKKLKELEGEY